MYSIDILLSFWTVLVIVLLATAAMTAEGTRGPAPGAGFRLARREPGRQQRRWSPPV